MCACWAPLLVNLTHLLNTLTVWRVVCPAVVVFADQMRPSTGVQPALLIPAGEMNILWLSAKALAANTHKNEAAYP